MGGRENRRLLVVGIGNEAMKDDGLGVCLIRELRRRSWPAEIELAVLGSDPLDLLLMDDEADCMVFLDAVSSGAPAGTVHRLELEEAFPSADGRAPNSLHHLGLKETLGLARAMGRNVSAVVLGVECEAIGPGQKLTDRLSAMLPDVAETVAEEITKIYRTITVSPTAIC